MSFSVEPLAGHDPAAVLAELITGHDDFWDGRDTRFLLHPLWFRQFQGYGHLACESGRTVGYLLGVVTLDRIGYVHAVAVRAGHRRYGIGRALWRAFIDQARTAGAHEVHAVTSRGNTDSVAFHTGLGMTADEIADYGGPGQARVLMRRVL